MNHDMLVCPLLDGLDYSGDITIRVSAGRRADFQRIQGDLTVEAASNDAFDELHAKLLDRSRFPGRILDQPFDLMMSGGSFDVGDFPTRYRMGFEAVIGANGPFVNAEQWNGPTANEIKVMIDQLNVRVGAYIVEPDDNKLADSSLARRTVHAGIDLVFRELERLRAENKRLKEK